MGHLLEAIGDWIKSVIGSSGYLGVMLLMALESACIPLPSEVIMPFGGALTLASIAAKATPTGQPLNLHGVALAGALGCALGSALAWFVGYRGGREFVFKYGKYILLKRRDVERSEEWFARWGGTAVFVSRLLPVVRTFISLPAGVARMPFVPFVTLSFLGSVPWCYLLAWIGIKVAGNLDVLKKYFHGADAVIGILILIGAALWIRHHLQPDHDEPRPTKE